MATDDRCARKLAMMLIVQHRDVSQHVEQIRLLRDDVRRMVVSWGYGTHINWGLTHSADCSGRFHPQSAAILDERRAQNYYLFHFSQSRANLLLQRLQALDYDVLVAGISAFVEQQYRTAVDGVSVFGGFLYGDARRTPADIDLLVCLKDSAIYENPVTMRLPAAIRDPAFRRCPSDGALGLTIIGDRAIEPDTENYLVLDAAVWDRTVALPIYGNALSCAEAPPAAVLYKTIVSTVWGFKHLLLGDREFLITGLTRLSENWYAIGFVRRSLGLPAIDVLELENLMYDVIFERKLDMLGLRDYFYRVAMEQREHLVTIAREITQHALERLEEIVA